MSAPLTDNPEYIDALEWRIWQHLGGPLRAIASFNSDGRGVRSPESSARLLNTIAMELGVGEWFYAKAMAAETLAPPGAPAIGFHGRAALLAEGADRSAFPLPVEADWAKAAVLTHPMQPAAALRLTAGAASADLDRLTKEIRRIGQLARIGNPSETVRFERISLLLWLRQRELCTMVGGPFAEHLPADPQLPDHAAWSTARIAAAVAGVGVRGPDAEPVLARVSLHGVQPYIAEARKARDLWTACMVFGELTWAAMGPIIDHCGPEAILYPDLRGNALMYQTLLSREREERSRETDEPGDGPPGAPSWLEGALPESARATGGSTRAVPVPNTFAALLPAKVHTRDGGELTAEALLDECARAAAGRWEELRAATRALLEEPHHPDRHVVTLGSGPWTAIYERSTKQGPALSWTLSPWEHLLHNLGPRPDAMRGPPDWSEGHTPGEPSDQTLRNRQLRALVSPNAWAEHDQLFYAAWGQQPELLRAERGFDYPLQHARLLGLHEATGRGRFDPPPSPEPGEKCTLTGRHEALHNGAGVGTRAAAKALWQRAGADDNGAVSERLGGPGAMKRYLADVKGPKGIVPRWQGVGVRTPLIDGAPFPSTAGVAATPWLRALWELILELRKGPPELPGLPVALAELGSLEKRVLAVATEAGAAFNEGGLHPAIHPWALHALKGGGEDTLAALVGLEAQRWSISAQQAIADRLAQGDQRDRVNALITDLLVPFFRGLRRAARALAEAREAQNKSTGQRLGASDFELLVKQVAAGPGEHCAILAMDGDGISKLVGGDPGALRARWRDTLHPDVVKGIAGAAAEADTAVGAAIELLDRPRAMSPALHGTLTRALADLTDRIAPWVIEVEFNGRLLYAGGDDLLAMLPAEEALPAAARIQQLFSAAWLIDTAPDSTAWDRRDEIKRAQAQARFAVLDLARLDHAGLQLAAGAVLPVEAHCFAAAATEGPLSLSWSPGSQLMPMVGRAHSLSAGIAYGHFKEPLRDVIASARANLELRAKPATKARGPAPEERALPASEWTGRGWMGHVAVSRLTGGDKATAVLPWGDGDGALGVASPPMVAKHLEALRSAIANGQVSSRLPYAMRERLRVVLAALDVPQGAPAAAAGVMPGPDVPEDRQPQQAPDDVAAERRRARAAAVRLANREARDQRKRWIEGALKAEGLSDELLHMTTWLLTEADIAVGAARHPDDLLAPLLIARHLAGAGGAE
ncbi:MAG: type III-B CRISPR-associated protein Cas10/Cmr2 [Deltaproteobacteria bacterium]|nr:type III-B CRISPR-associated protein Cas10/Cmr2 [Deltaproteobacteria bacterium]